jgi:LmbE family N-acetylglucosaminyl deacetylase
MKPFYGNFLFSIGLLIFTAASLHAQQDNGKIRIIMFGAHPDDCDERASGIAALYAQMGYAVKFVSVTNGDAGHQTMKGKELAKRRYAETQESAKRLGITYDVLDNHDGLLMPSLEVRLEIIKEIREWNADIVFAPRPNDYHPDHRYTGVLVQDAAYMVAVPNIEPEIPATKKNPVFFYYEDHFQRPNPFRPDVVVDITSVYEKKIAALDAHQSQMYEWLPWIGHYSEEVPQSEADRIKWLAVRTARPINPDIRASLEKWYGKEKADKVKYVECFEICEYGAQPKDEDIKKLFPMLGK